MAAKYSLKERETRLKPKEIVERIFGIKPLEGYEEFSIIRNVSAGIGYSLKEEASAPLGPKMYRSLLSPPENLDSGEIEGQKFISLEVGGTNFRAGLVEIKDGKAVFLKKLEIQELTRQYLSQEGFFEELLKFGLGDLLKENPNLPLACIFSFEGKGELADESLGMVITHTAKGWTIPGIYGKNIGVELNKFLENKGLGKRQHLFLNDTVALITDKRFDLGLVCASGYNWAVKVLTKRLGESHNIGFVDYTILNTELGQAQFTPRMPILMFLRQRLAEEEHEKLENIKSVEEQQVSGKFLGKILGATVESLRKEQGLFQTAKRTQINKSFVVSYVLDEQWKKVNKELGVAENISLSQDEKDLLRQIATSLRDRSAQIVACHFVGLWQTVLNKKDFVRIASDGPIVQRVPGWKEKFLEEVAKLTEGKVKVEIIETTVENRDDRGILDVAFQATHFFKRQEKNLPHYQ